MVSTKQSPKSTRTSAQMFPLIRKWEEGNERQKEFCARHGIKPHIFWYWLRRYRERSKDLQKAAKGFIPIKMEEAKGEFAEIIYPNGTRLVFKERVELKFLQGLVPKR